MEEMMYKTFQYLVEEQDIEEITLNINYKYETLIINFKWIIDCGCFNISSQSCLTILYPHQLYPKITQNLKKKTGKIYQLISNHKNYTGELIDLREVNNENRR